MGVGHVGLGIAAIWGVIALLTLLPRLGRWIERQLPSYKRRLARLQKRYATAERHYGLAKRDDDKETEQYWDVERCSVRAQLWEMQR